MDPITNSDDIIDSRNIIERIKELESDRDAADAEGAEALEAWDESGDGDELRSLKSLAEDAEGYSPFWQYGETLIRDSYFEEYAQELAADIGAIDPKANWPLNCIDWGKAADELKQDYTSVEFDGVEYWVR